MVSALMLTERDDSAYVDGKPKVKGRIVTTLEKAKEIRPLVEKCITIARKGLVADQAAEPFATTAERNTEAWKAWRESDQWGQWVAARAAGLAARRRVLSLIRDKEAVQVLFSTVAPRFMDRPGGYTRILRLAKPRLGDAGTRAIIEFVGQNDRVKKAKAAKPTFATEEASS